MGYPHFKKPPYIYIHISIYIYVYISYTVVPISPFRHGRGIAAPHLGTQLPDQVIGAPPHIEILEGLEADTVGHPGDPVPIINWAGVARNGRGRWLQNTGING